jgi:hypothetical protein
MQMTWTWTWVAEKISLNSPLFGAAIWGHCCTILKKRKGT